jgi:hypothetical protein
MPPRDFCKAAGREVFLLIRIMDILGSCIDTLRALAPQSADPKCYLLAERSIAEYLRSPGASLENLSGAINRAAETSETDITFWTAIQEFVSTLPPNETEQ